MWYPLSQKNYFTNLWSADHVFSLNKTNIAARSETSNSEKIIISLDSVIMSEIPKE